jgi:hypothetical protein
MSSLMFEGLVLALRISLVVVVLWWFLTRAVHMSGTDLRAIAFRMSGRNPDDPGPLSTPYGRLVVIDPGSSGLSSGDSVVLQAINTIGRDPDNSISIGPDGILSGKHLLIHWRDGAMWLEDRNSRNGTLLNGAPISRATMIRPNDQITIGSMTLQWIV